MGAGGAEVRSKNLELVAGSLPQHHAAGSANSLSLVFLICAWGSSGPLTGLLRGDELIQDCPWRSSWFVANAMSLAVGVCPVGGQLHKSGQGPSSGGRQRNHGCAWTPRESMGVHHLCSSFLFSDRHALSEICLRQGPCSSGQLTSQPSSSETSRSGHGVTPGAGSGEAGEQTWSHRPGAASPPASLFLSGPLSPQRPFTKKQVAPLPLLREPDLA